MKKILSAFLMVISGVCISAMVAIGFSGLSDFDTPADTAEISFQDGDNHLSGTLNYASGNGPVVVLVHGDGPQDRFADGYYLPLIHTLTEAGISVYTWDKPGVGSSTGDWLKQSMEDRARETAMALSVIRSNPKLSGRSTGVIGFSQAGWVLPQLYKFTEDIDFQVLIGAAISWREQNLYHTRIRLLQEGLSPESVDQKVKEESDSSDSLFSLPRSYQHYVDQQKYHTNAALMTEARYNFVRLNYHSDSREHLDQLHSPILVLSGQEDLNTDAQETVSVFRSVVGSQYSENEFLLIPDATHGLLDADYFNYQSADQWPLSRVLKFLWLGRKAYQKGALATLTEWIAQFDNQTTHEKTSGDVNHSTAQ